MKKLLSILTLYFIATTVNAQSDTANLKMPSTVIMPDGSVVPVKSR
jgi:hypothetical protein